MSVEENMALARRFLEAHFKGDLDAMDEMMTPDFVGHTKLLPDQQPDREGMKWAYAHFSAAVSNLSIHFEDQIAAGDKVVTRFIVHATRDRGGVEQELRVAQRIQQASLPKEVPTLEGWQITPYYQPARDVGGDFYDFHLFSEGKLGLAVGDATGKGVPAALV